MHHFDWLNGFVYPYINFAIYLGILYFVGRPAVTKMLVAKRDAFNKQFEEAKRAREIAEAQSKELQIKLAGLDKEISHILANAKSTAESEAAEIIKSAKDLAEHIKTEAKRMALAEVDAARDALKQEIILAVNDVVAKKVAKEITLEQHLHVISRDIDVLKQVNAAGGIG